MPKNGPNPIDVHVGARIRVRRMMLGQSQGKLALGLGITFQQVQKYEKGTNRVGASRLQHIATLLGVPVSYFFAGEDTSLLAQPNGSVSEDAIISFLSSRQGIELNSAFLKLENTKVRQRVVQLVTLIAKNEDGISGGEDGLAQV
ncbi:helix-turn-helix domain-containing protein [Rhizobium sp. LjRoot254]|uniref:helix-turn-helix domain-containing protein n=1 Tax=Rhizobium sp. LjRoot254 TaxID=3342297 RepID=UPI003ECECA1E